MGKLYLKRLIYLTGFTGSGKSTLGPLLSDAFSWRFVDLDTEIEAQLRKPVPVIFRENGESLFRSAETDILQRLSEGTEMVVALGAGTIVNPLNLQRVKESGVLIYLMATPEDILGRIARTEKRLLFLSGNSDQPLTDQALLERIRWLMALRNPYYLQSDIHISTSGKTIEAVLNEIILDLKLK
ncbi:MAG: shikimate kinase [Calditrichaeota bacterium]|nr:shikimate kinase [Calditrichota bacterium]